MERFVKMYIYHRGMAYIWGYAEVFIPFISINIGLLKSLNKSINTEYKLDIKSILS